MNENEGDEFVEWAARYPASTSDGYGYQLCDDEQQARWWVERGHFPPLAEVVCRTVKRSAWVVGGAAS